MIIDAIQNGIVIDHITQSESLPIITATFFMRFSL